MPRKSIIAGLVACGVGAVALLSMRSAHRHDTERSAPTAEGDGRSSAGSVGLAGSSDAAAEAAAAGSGDSRSAARAAWPRGSFSNDSAATWSGPLSAAQSMTVALDALTASGLLSELPEVLRMLDSTRPTRMETAIDRQFREMARNPSAETIEQFQTTILTELQNRRADRAIGLWYRQTPDGESDQQLALRMVIAAELARSSRRVTPAQADATLARSFDAINTQSMPSFNSPSNLQSIVVQMLEKRLGTEPDARERSLVSDVAPDDDAIARRQDDERRAIRSMLKRAMTNAAASQTPREFESYAKRSLALTIARRPEDQAAELAAEQEEIQRLREQMRRNGLWGFPNR